MDLLDEETRLVFGAEEPLPAKPGDGPELAGDEAMICGDLDTEGKRCRVFWGVRGAPEACDSLTKDARPYRSVGVELSRGR